MKYVSIIGKQSVFSIVLFFLILNKPIGFAINNIMVINSLLNYTIIELFVIVILDFIVSKKNRFEILIVSYFTLLFIISIINDMDMEGFVKNNFQTLTFALYISGQCQKANIKNLARGGYIAYYILLAFNLFWMLSKIGTNFLATMLGVESDIAFLTIDNWMANYTIAAVIFLCIDCIYNCNAELRMHHVILLIIDVLTTIIVWSGTGLLGFMICLILLIFAIIVKKNIVGIKVFLGIYLVAFFSICIFRIQRYFMFIIGFLGKDINFTGRVVAWDNAIKAIIQSPIWGHGYGYKVFYGMNAHNGILERLVEVGIIGFAIYSLVVVISIKAIEKVEFKDTAIIYSICMFSFWIISLGEGEIEWTMLYGLLALMSTSPYYIKSDTHKGFTIRGLRKK